MWNDKRIKRAIIKTFWYNELGRAKVLARTYGMIPELMMVFTFLKVYGIRLSYFQMALVGVSIYALTIFLGFLYAKFDLLRIETDLINKHNPLFQKLDKTLKEEK